jgi:hypothetical protein
MENIDEVPIPDGLGAVNHVAGGRLRNDGRNFFVKASYLFRFLAAMERRAPRPAAR